MGVGVVLKCYSAHHWLRRFAQAAACDSFSCSKRWHLCTIRGIVHSKLEARSVKQAEWPEWPPAAGLGYTNVLTLKEAIADR